MLKDFIAQQPSSVIRNVIVDEQRVSIPTHIDRVVFFKMFKEDIESETLTDEKSIYTASLVTPKGKKSLQELLVKGR